MADIIQSNPRLKEAMLTVLAACRDAGQPIDRSRLEEVSGEHWSERCTQSPASIVDALIRCAALEEELSVDGVPYEGDAASIRRDASISESAEIARTVSITEHGRSILEEHDPSRETHALFASKQEYVPIFKEIIELCEASKGASREQIEQLVSSHKNITCGADGTVRVYPQYFMDSLESVGAISWDGAWRSTPTGRGLNGTS